VWGCDARSPHSYVFQPENAMPIGTFIDEKDDAELLDILPILLELQNVRNALRLSAV
jgi:RNA polymerase II subunit A small phosphatase-like protein